MEDKSRIGAEDQDCEELASYASAMEGVLCAATVRERTPGCWKLSVRCDADYINGSDICARMGGGGHAAAAGATLPAPMTEQEVRTLVYESIMGTLKEKVR
jgi:phosphoesterase RecJ-like protein